MKLHSTLSAIISIFYFHLAFAQGPDIEWQNTIGGFNDDKMRDVVACADGGFLLCGVSWSGLTGDKTEHLIGQEDFWIVKVDSIGNILWQNTIGGTDYDFINQAIQTNDGGFLLGGYSQSNKNGDKSENRIGSYDYWVVKLSAAGTIQWQNTIGGTSYDYIHSVVEMPDGRYFIAGYSASGISGDKNEASMGNDDYWILMLSNTGTIMWQNTIGGSGFDYLYSAIRTSDGGFFIGGHSSSDSTGNKSQNSFGLTDYWVLKLDSMGNIQWDKTIGGSGEEELWSVLQTDDGGYLLGGNSTSGVSGNKTEPNFGIDDYYIVKLDSVGNLEWQKDIGGTSIDLLLKMIKTADGGSLLAGFSISGISGNKTQANLGSYDYWIIKTNADGNIDWQKTLGGTDADELRGIVQTDDFGYLLAGHSASPVSIDKSDPPVGALDYWVLKLYPCTEEICNGIDDNCNGLIDDGPVISATIAPDGATTFCQGENVMLTSTYTGTPLQWKRNGIPIPGAIYSNYLVNKKGNYTFSVYGICDTVLSNVIEVIVYKNPTANITAGGPTSFCMGGSVLLSEAPSAGCTYQWYKGIAAIPGATEINYVATIAGNYRCRVTKTTTGCSTTSNVINVTVPCREDGISENNLIVLYPNPATNMVTITGLPKAETYTYIRISNITGKLMYQGMIDEKEPIMDVSKYLAGIYFFHINIDGEEFILKCIKL